MDRAVAADRKGTVAAKERGQQAGTAHPQRRYKSTHTEKHENLIFLILVVFLTAMKFKKLRKAHYSPPLVGEDNSMVFTSHSVPFPATRDLRSLVAENGTS